MPTVRFTAVLKKIQMASDVQVVLQVLRPDETAPKLVPMRNLNVWVDMATEQPDIEDLGARVTEPDSQMRLTFDDSRFQVSALEDGRQELGQRCDLGVSFGGNGTDPEEADQPVRSSEPAVTESSTPVHLGHRPR